MQKKRNHLLAQPWLGWFIISLSLLVKLWMSKANGLWLDEQYSLYFAASNNFSKLLFFFGDDVHPGGYYVLLKSMLVFSQDLQILRLITSIIPQLLGLSLIWIFRKKLPFSAKELTLVLAFLSLNPFFNYTIAQLRPYGLAFLVVIATQLVFTLFQKKPTKQLLVAFVALLTLAHWISYTLFFLTIGYAIFLIWFYSRPLSLKEKLLFSLLATAVLVGQFLLIGSNNLSKHFTPLSWIAPARISSFTNVYLTGSGLGTDIHNVGKNFLASWLLIGGLIGLIAARKFVWQQWKKNKWLKEVIIVVGLPAVLIAGLSFLMPWLSKQVVFSQFVPNISLLLPRAHLPFLVLLGWYLPLVFRDILKKTSQLKNWLAVLLFLLLGFWAHHSYLLAGTNYTLYNPELAGPLMATKNNTITWPSWLWIRAITPENVAKHASITSGIDRSKGIESLTWNPYQGISGASREICEELHRLGPSTVVMQPAFLTQSEQIPAKKMQTALEDCCQLISDEQQFVQWSCPRKASR